MKPFSFRSCEQKLHFSYRNTTLSFDGPWPIIINYRYCVEYALPVKTFYLSAVDEVDDRKASQPGLAI